MILYVRRKGMSTEVLKEILAYIDEHIYEKISLLEMAEMAGYSPFYFSKLFSEIISIAKRSGGDLIKIVKNAAN
jgi:AraC-like DNA-binding protein